MSLPPDLLSLAEAHRRRQQELARKASRVLGRLWARVDPANALASWRANAAPEALRLLTAAQLAAADGADGYVAAALARQDVTGGSAGQVDAATLAGIASDGRPLDSLLEQPAFEVSAFVADGMQVGAASTIGARHLTRIVATQVADAARVATGVATVASRASGYVRMLTPPSCSRCVVLAGKFYRASTGFQRHPLCDCVHIPAAESLRSTVTSPRDYFDSLDSVEQDRIFTAAGAQAIRDGADVGQVVNARRGGLSTAAGSPYRRRSLRRVEMHGQPLYVTTEGLSKASVARPRLMPESVYEIAGNDREQALRLLERNGYLRKTTVSSEESGSLPRREPTTSAGLPQRVRGTGGGGVPPARPGIASAGDPELPDLGALVDADLAVYQAEVQDGFVAALERDYGDGFTTTLSQVSEYRHGPSTNKFVELDIRRGGLPVGELSLMYYRDPRGDLVAYHTLLTLTEQSRGARFGGDLMAHLERWYRASGVSRIEFVANIDVGGYAWASMGYNFATQEAAEEILRLLEEAVSDEYATAERLRHRAEHAAPQDASRLRGEADAIDAGALAAEDMVDRGNRLQFGDPRYPTAYEISQVGRMPGMGRDDRWLGKRVMLGSSWEAVRWLR